MAEFAIFGTNTNVAQICAGNKSVCHLYLTHQQENNCRKLLSNTMNTNMKYKLNTIKKNIHKI